MILKNRLNDLAKRCGSAELKILPTVPDDNPYLGLRLQFGNRQIHSGVIDETTIAERAIEMIEEAEMRLATEA